MSEISDNVGLEAGITTIYARREMFIILRKQGNMLK